MVGGSPAAATLTLAAPAPAGGETVTVVSDNPSVAWPLWYGDPSAPVTVTVPAGHRRATFSLLTSPVSSATAVHITASAGSQSATETVIVDAPSLDSLRIDPHEVTAGQSATGIVALNGPAPAAGVTLSLYSSNAGLAAPAATVVVPPGASSTEFEIPTAVIGGAHPADVFIAAVQTGVAGCFDYRVKDLVVRPGVLPSTYYLVRLYTSPNPIAAGYFTGVFAQISQPAPAGGLSINVTTNSPDVSLSPLGGPPTIVIPEGQTTGLIVVAGGQVTMKTRATLVGTLVNPDASGTSTAKSDLTITPDNLLGLQLTPATVTGGSSSIATVTIAHPAPVGGLLLNLRSDTPDVAQVPTPAVVVVPGGSTTVSFPVTTVPVASESLAPIHAFMDVEDVGGLLDVTPF